jgi:zinc protease
MKTRLSILLCTAAAALGAHADEIEGLPKPAEPRPAKLAAPHEKTLANGLRVVVVERPGLPLVSAELLLLSGAEADPPQFAGLAQFTAALLTQGTETRTATQIAQEVEALGASLKAEADFDSTVVGLTTLSGQVEPACALLADVTRHPKFAPEEIERLRKQTLDELRLALEEPGTVAKLAASRVILGSGLYAQPKRGTIGSIKKLRRAEIAGFHTSRYTASQAQLLVAGNITADAAFALAEKNFGDWQAAPDQPAPAPAPFAPVAKPRAVLIDMPNAGQAAVVLGAPGIARKADDYFAGTVANAALGGGYTSRLNQEIRVKRGLSYGAGSSLNARRSGGAYLARCQTKNASAPEVVTLMQTELKRLGSEPLPADFFAARQATLSGDFARELETNTGYVESLAGFAIYGLPPAELTHYLERIQQVTPEAARAFAEQHFVAEAASVIVAGRAKDCAAALRKLFPTLEVIPQAELDLDSPTLRHAARR